MTAGEAAGIEPMLLPGPGDRLPEDAVAVIRERTGIVPSVAVILGSGLSSAADDIEEDAAFSFEGLPGFPPPAVPGHAGRLVVGHLHGIPVAAFLGRIHFYEGHEMAVSALPVRVARLLGAGVLVLTAAVGALDPELREGDLVVATDHINLMGHSPLRGWRNTDGTPPFIEVSNLYTGELASAALEEAEGLGLRARPGVYVAVAGPSYETPAEIRLMREAGGTVVGMSVVPEALPAAALGMRVLGLFAVTNTAGAEVSHEDVVREGAGLGRTLGRLFERLLPRIGEDGGRERSGDGPAGPEAAPGGDG